ncbi:MAG: patatin-like phospholipase family protein [Pseudomonadota bacterium]|nr:patatin-like phospholipase family protein [Pseudomonadota bacterium]
MQIRPNLGLILTGGGARAAYQAGVLRALAELMPNPTRNPFPIITGTSAGAINAAALAGDAANFGQGVQHLLGTWKHMHVNKVFRTDAGTIYKSGAHWVAALASGGLGKRNPRCLLDNTPLRGLLESHLRLSRISLNILQGHLRAVGITASGYSTGRTICFYEGEEHIRPWQRIRRRGVPARINLDHVMASLAIPLLFPAVRIGGEYMGDGAMRQSTPLSHAIHLGAERLLVVGTRNDVTRGEPLPSDRPEYPSLGDIGGYVLDTLFMDSVQSDAERLGRVNDLVRALPRDQPPTEDGRPLRKVELKILVPSEDLRPVAQHYRKAFPRPVRHLLRGIGAMDEDSPIPSYLLFDQVFCSALIDLGYRDAMDQSESLKKFLFF